MASSDSQYSVQAADNNQNSSSQKYKLRINQFQMLSQQVFNESYAIITNMTTKKRWETPKFFSQMFEVWSTEVDGPSLKMQLFMKKKNVMSKVADARLDIGAETIFLKQINNPSNKFCVLRYQLWELKDVLSLKPVKKIQKYFDTSNVFNTLEDGLTDISRVEQVKEQIRPAKLGNSDEKVGFHIDLSMISSEAPSNNLKHQRDHSNDEEKKYFHLDDSVSFIDGINDMLGKNQKHAENHRNNQELPNINEESEEEYRNTLEEWYSKKFNKNSLKNRKKRNTISSKPQRKQSINSKNQVKIVSYNTDFLEKEEIVRQISEMSVQEDVKLKSIDFSLTTDGDPCKMYSISREDGDTSSLWYTAISLPSQGLIMVECQTDEGELSGCMGTEQIMKGQCPLFDSQGKNYGNFKFKCKSISNYVVQTHQFLEIEKPEEDVLKENDQLTNVGVDSFRKISGESSGSPFSKKKENPEVLAEEVIYINDTKEPEISAQQLKELSEKYEEAEEEERLRKIQQNRQLERLRKQKQKEDQERVRKQKEEAREIERKKRVEQENQEKQRIEKQRQKIKNENEIEKQRSIDSIGSQDSNNNRQNSEKQVERQGQNDREEDQSNNERKLKIEESIEEEEQQERQKEKLKSSQNVKNIRRKRLISQNIYDHQPEPRTKDNGQTFDLNNYSQKHPQGNSSPIDSFMENDSPRPYKKSKKYSHTKQVSYEGSRPPKERRNSNFIRYDTEMGDASYRDQRRSSNKSQNESEVHLQRLSNLSKKKRRFNMKIESVMLKFVKPNYNSKCLKMSINNDTFYTESSKDLYFSHWQGRGYLYLGVEEFSVLYLNLIEENESEQFISGVCKIFFACLDTSEFNITKEYDDFVRNQSESQVAKLKLVYKIVDKNIPHSIDNKHRDLQSSHTTKFLNNSPIKITRGSVNHIKTLNKSNTYRMATDVSSRATQSYSIRQSVARQQFMNKESVLSQLKIQSPMRRRKYTGGNNLFPKANRFQVNSQRDKKYEPGPGAYDTPSPFDRHAAPL